MKMIKMTDVLGGVWWGGWGGGQGQMQFWVVGVVEGVEEEGVEEWGGDFLR